MYDRFPCSAVGTSDECLVGWAAICTALRDLQPAPHAIAVECYPGTNEEEIIAGLSIGLPGAAIASTSQMLRSPEAIEAMVTKVLGDDPVFGIMNSIRIEDFFDPKKINDTRKSLENQSGPSICVGVGATLIFPEPDLLLYADLARWEIQQRQRRNELGNLGAANRNERPSLKYKRAFFVDWRAADRLKVRLLPKADLVLDTNSPGHPKAISGEVFRRSLHAITRRPFRVVPFFDPGPWGGHWMEQVCNLPADGSPNHAWCFDCVPEENSLLLGFGDKQIEIPALDLVLMYPKELLGEHVVDNYGAEFPIRFDFLDTMGGGNLSLQVHPLQAYIQKHFGMQYTQDESYYLLDAEPDACVYLGLKEDIDRTAMLRDLQAAQGGSSEFHAEAYVNRFPARKHDHFLIPAGTVHCSGKNSMVLEISATPYIFTFKLWDWGRLGLDGLPRPIHLAHGAANIQWERTEKWVREALVNRITPLKSGVDWREERTGLHEFEFIETRRHWFTGVVSHDTQGTVHVLNLVEGDAVIVESPDRKFPPYTVHYAETFIVPAAVGKYTIRPSQSKPEHEYATILAYVRG